MMFALWARDLISVVRIRESQCNRSFFLTEILSEFYRSTVDYLGEGFDCIILQMAMILATSINAVVRESNVTKKTRCC